MAAPVVNLSADGKTAKGRWDVMVLRADAKGNASIEGGIYENVYVKEDGVWKFACKTVVLDSRQIDTLLAIPI